MKTFSVFKPTPFREKSLDTRKTCLPSNDGAQLNTLAIKLGFPVMKFVIYAYWRQKYCYGHGLI